LSNTTRGQSGPTSNPHDFASVVPNPLSMPAYSNQMLFDIHHNLGRMEVTLENLCKQHDTLQTMVAKEAEKQSSALTSAIDRIEKLLTDKHLGYDARFSRFDKFVYAFGGFAACMSIMVPVFWWLTGERIENALKGPSPVEQTEAAPIKKK